jgi:hypothetical protein
MLLWELAFEKKPYEYKYEHVETTRHVREEIDFDFETSEVAKFQIGYEKIIRQGKLLRCKNSFFGLFLI